MRFFTRTTVLLFITLFYISCSSDGDEVGRKQNETIEEATIDSFSKNYGYIGDVVVISGTNFTNNIDDIEVLFGDIKAQIKSVDKNKIEVILPVTEQPISDLIISIKNRNVVNNVENDYSNSIGVLDITPNKWHISDINYPNNGPIYISKAIGKKKLYFSTNDCCGTGVYRTLDEGITWNLWGRSGSLGEFYVTNNDEGWSQTTFGVNRIPIGGSETVNMDVHKSTQTTGLYIDDDLVNGFLIDKQKIVYQTTDGVSFNEVYNNKPKDETSSRVTKFSQLDKDNIWAAGYIDISGEKFPDFTPANDFLAPLILFPDNGSWKEVTISNLEATSQVVQIQFINKNIGYINVSNENIIKGSLNNIKPLNKLLKSVDGGNSWDLIYDTNDVPIKAFSFKDQMIGWYCLGNNIYKTTDGGVTWKVDYSHNSEIKTIAYDSGLVWALSDNKIFKYFID